MTADHNQMTTRDLRIDPTLRGLLPRMAASEMAALREDIARRGVVYPLLVDEEGTILDGHHRYEAARSLTPPMPYRVEVRAGLTTEGKRLLARAVNLYRRHMTPEERRPNLEALRAEGLSTRQIAEMAGVDHSTVMRDLSTGARAPVDKGDEIDGGTPGAAPVPQRIVGKDGRSRPSHKTGPERIAERRQQVKEHIERGLTQREVAEMLGVSQSVVSSDWIAATTEQAAVNTAPSAQSSWPKLQKPRLQVSSRPSRTTDRPDATERAVRALPAEDQERARQQIARVAVEGWVARVEGAIEIMPALPSATIARLMPPEMRRRWPDAMPRFVAFLAEVGKALEDSDDEDRTQGE